jgi:hypothetical protein
MHPPPSRRQTCCRCLSRPGGPPPGIRLSAIFITLARQCQRVGAFKTARFAHSKLQVCKGLFFWGGGRGRAARSCRWGEGVQGAGAACGKLRVRAQSKLRAGPSTQLHEGPSHAAQPSPRHGPHPGRLRAGCRRWCCRPSGSKRRRWRPWRCAHGPSPTQRTPCPAATAAAPPTQWSTRRWGRASVPGAGGRGAGGGRAVAAVTPFSTHAHRQEGPPAVLLCTAGRCVRVLWRRLHPQPHHLGGAAGCSV